MAFVVTQPCSGCKYTDCVDVCPCDCFYHDDLMVYIDPDPCIDCNACATACPVDAIYHEADVPTEWQHFIQMNADKAASCEHISESQEPLDQS